VLARASGVIVLDYFGEPPFKPVEKQENLRPDQKQTAIFHRLQNKMASIRERHVPRSETSFTVISFPNPEIRGDYERIFEDFLEINMVDTEQCEQVQQRIIDVLDRADHVHVKGKAGNQTDIKVQLQSLEDPAKQTRFLNCGADVNIPVGEVFTSPRLAGTSGCLHFAELCARGLKYVNLKLVLENGYIVQYGCENYPEEEANRSFIQKNLLSLHETLPLGEFAIGTNTLAYVVARKHDIMDLLPALVIEKMGPHFAVGDTCFAREEEHRVFNRLDGKEVVARENEKTARRRSEPESAYTNCHTDMTLPYECIEFITAVTRDGERVDILRDERFVLEGTEELNRVLDEPSTT
jgi:leucyl aminopeptidase (aminopeptidase T)